MLRHILVIGLLLFSLTTLAQQYPSLTAAQRIGRLSPPETPLRVVIDTDTYNEIDDQFAVVYALFSPEQLTIEAVYAAPFKNHRSESAGEGMEKSYEEILRLLERTQTPTDDFVYRGSNEFLSSKDKPVDSDAAQNLIDRALGSDEPLYVLTLGAPTNVASAILMEPSIKEKIVVIWLGGKGPTWPSASEFNLQQDVMSSQVMFDSGVPLVQIPTQPVTSHLLLSIPEAEKYLQGQGAIGDYLLEIFRQYPKEVNADEYAWSKVVWDISAVAYAINPSWFQSELRATPILTDEKTYSFDNRRPLYRTVTYLNRDKIFGDMFRKIEQHATTSK